MIILAESADMAIKLDMTRVDLLCDSMQIILVAFRGNIESGIVSRIYDRENKRFRWN